MFGVGSQRAQRIFLVYGRNREAHSRLSAILASYGLKVLTWEGAIAMTGSAAPHAREILETAMRNVGAVVVLMSGDEEARLRSELCADHELLTEGSLQPQARPNVIFEAGLAFALFPKQTVLAQLGRLRPISDLAGIQYVPLDDSPQSHNALANRLRTAGCRLDIPRSGGLPASGLPAADTGLPPVEGDAGAAARVALFRRLRSALPLPGMGGSLELAAEATLGENLVLSLHLPSTAINFRLHHWLPGASLPRRLDLASTEKTSSVVTLALSMRGPAGVHFFDLLTAEEGSRTWQVAARARCVVGER